MVRECHGPRVSLTESVMVREYTYNGPRASLHGELGTCARGRRLGHEEAQIRRCALAHLRIFAQPRWAMSSMRTRALVERDEPLPRSNASAWPPGRLPRWTTRLKVQGERVVVGVVGVEDHDVLRRGARARRPVLPKLSVLPSRPTERDERMQTESRGAQIMITHWNSVISCQLWRRRGHRVLEW